MMTPQQHTQLNQRQQQMFNQQQMMNRANVLTQQQQQPRPPLQVSKNKYLTNGEHKYCVSLSNVAFPTDNNSRSNVLTEQQQVPPLQVNDNKYLARQEHCLAHKNTASTTDNK